MVDALPLSIGLFGGTGKMGRAIRLVLEENTSCRLSHVFVGDGSQTTQGFFGADVLVLPDQSPVFNSVFKPSVCLDFSSPDAALKHLHLAHHHKIPFLIGTTGLPVDFTSALEKAALDIPVIQAANTSIGITVLSLLAQKAAALLGADFDISISETHHRYKKDAPSGTALHLGTAVSKGRNLHPDDIEYAVMRGGGVIGDHAVHFLGDDESITLSHRGFSRSLFAQGALKAAAWLTQQPPGLYTMEEALGI